MIVAVKSSISTGSMSMSASGSRFWILANGATEAQPPGTTVTFPGGVCTDWTVPEGVIHAIAELNGACGAGSLSGHNATHAQRGYGAYIKAILRLTPGHAMRTCVGGAGNIDGRGGFNGGGNGTSNFGSGGGGMTSIYDLTLGVYLLIAAGGGGGGRSDVGGGGAGGNGGWPAGGTGGASAISGGAPGGSGGTQSAGFQQFQGELTATAFSGTTSGGGAGWWGAFAGGSRTGGGGGSSYYNPLYAVLVAHVVGGNNNPGTATISY